MQFLGLHSYIVACSTMELKTDQRLLAEHVTDKIPILMVAHGRETATFTHAEESPISVEPKICMA